MGLQVAAHPAVAPGEWAARKGATVGLVPLLHGNEGGSLGCHVLLTLLWMWVQGRIVPRASTAFWTLGLLAGWRTKSAHDSHKGHRAGEAPSGKPWMATISVMLLLLNPRGKPFLCLQSCRAVSRTAPHTVLFLGASKSH